jgi:6-phosphogluconolactonase
MHIEILPDAAAAARWAAGFVAGRMREAEGERGRFLLALSGGGTPLPMYGALAREPLAWEHVELFQTDERAAAMGSDARNWSHIEQLLTAPAGMPKQRMHPMPTESADLVAAAAGYAASLTTLAGTPPVFDLIHLGLGEDGHTASLFPGDPALDVKDVWVTATGEHHGHRRMTLTLPTIDRAHCIVWLVCGEGKAAMLARLVTGDKSIPAGRVSHGHAIVIADAAAARLLEQS